jgi:hypothetical protein
MIWIILLFISSLWIANRLLIQKTFLFWTWKNGHIENVLGVKPEEQD